MFHRFALIVALFVLAMASSTSRSATITVTSTADSGAGSLRAAITTANGTAAADVIAFNIAGSCPRVILLTTPLPTITTDLAIEGYTQPGTALNTLDVGNDAVICIAILAQSGALNHAIEVDGAADVSVSVRGLAFGSGFLSGTISRAIQFLGGNGHVVQGNAFGGSGPGVFSELGEVSTGVAVFSDIGSLLVGGSSTGHRNTFGGVASSGIYIAGDTAITVRNNYFGLSASGNAGQSLDQSNGIYFNGLGTGSLLIDNVFAALEMGVLLSGSSDVLVRGNRFGLSATGNFGAQFANGYGVVLANGAHNNVIGDLNGSTQSNVITNSLLAGVYLKSDAGSGNVVRPNTIYGNAFGEPELGIDIHPPGQNPNDALDADSGPNDGQNWPLILDSRLNAENGLRTISGNLSSTPGRDFKIDFYRAVSCLPGGRAEAVTRIGTTTVTTWNGGALNGRAFFALDLTNAGAPGFVSAVATDLTTMSSSELSPCMVENFFDDDFG